MKLGIFIAALLTLAGNAHAAFDGTGTFNRLYNWEQDKANGINVRADRMDAEMDGMATGLSTCVTKDGQTTLTGNLPMSTFKLTNVGNATSGDQYAAANQVRDNTLCIGTPGGIADTYTFQRTIAGSAYVTGTVVYLNPGATNTGASTLNLDSLGAKPIYKGDVTALGAGDLLSGTTYPLIYDGSGFQIMGGAKVAGGLSASPSQIISGSTSVQVASGTTTSNTATISFTVAGTNVAYLTSNALVVSGTVSATDSGVFAGLIVSRDVTATNVSVTVGSLYAVNISASMVSATLVSATNISATTITNHGVAIAGFLIGGTATCTISSSFGISSCTKVTATTGVYAVSFTTPRPNANYFAVCNTVQDNWVSVYRATLPAPNTAGFLMQTRSTSGNNDIQNGGISCIVLE